MERRDREGKKIKMAWSISQLRFTAKENNSELGLMKHIIQDSQIRGRDTFYQGVDFIENKKSNEHYVLQVLSRQTEDREIYRYCVSIASTNPDTKNKIMKRTKNYLTKVNLEFVEIK